MYVRTPEFCHPEARFWAKDLPESFRLDCTVLALLSVLVEEPRQGISYCGITGDSSRKPGFPTKPVLLCGWKGGAQNDSLTRMFASRLVLMFVLCAAEGSCAGFVPGCCLRFRRCAASLLSEVEGFLWLLRPRLFNLKLETPILSAVEGACGWFWFFLSPVPCSCCCLRFEAPKLRGFEACVHAVCKLFCSLASESARTRARRSAGCTGFAKHSK